jgi:hypothetical protein
LIVAVNSVPMSLRTGDCVMGVALFIVADRSVDEMDIFVNGKALAHCRPAGAKDRGGRQADRHLETLARQAGVRPLMEFFSASPEDILALFSEQDEEPPEVELPPEQWFSPDEGLTTVRGLLAYLEIHPDAAAEVDRLIEDLREFEEVLVGLNAAGAKWHLAVDC